MVNAGLKANLSLRELKSKLSAGPSSFLHTLKKNQLRRPPKGSRPPSSISLPVIEGCASYYKGLSSVVPWAKSFFSIRENMKQQENKPFIKAVPANFFNIHFLCYRHFATHSFSRSSSFILPNNLIVSSHSHRTETQPQFKLFLTNLSFLSLNQSISECFNFAHGAIKIQT